MRYSGRHRGPTSRAVAAVAVALLTIAGTATHAPPRRETDTTPIPVAAPAVVTVPNPGADALDLLPDVDYPAAIRAQAGAVIRARDRDIKERKAARKAAALAQLRREHRWTSPVWAAYVITSGYGMRHGKLHPAIDLGVPVGTKVRSMTSGRVVFAGWSTEGYGYMLLIRQWDGSMARYAHNSSLLVSIGDHVDPAQAISYSGNTGNSTGPHLHLEVWPDGVNPTPPRAWLARKGVRI